jgi:hypothetical protein
MDTTSSSQTVNSRPFDAAHIQQVIPDLLKQEKRQLAFDLLDVYYARARTLSDYDILGGLAIKADHRQLYLKCAEAAYAVAETSDQIYIARSNLYKAYNTMNLPERALFYIDINLRIKPNDFETLTQRAFNMSLMGDKESSERLLLELQKKHPERAKDMTSVFSGKMLREGQTAQGIISFLDANKKPHALFEESMKMKLWSGMAIPGRTVYVDGMGGIGDEIINIRFFKYLKDLGMRPILYSSDMDYRKHTVELFRRHGYEVLTDTITIDRSQYWTGLMSLPGYLNLDESKLWYGPYLTALNHPKNKLESTKFKIGIKCSGNPYFAQDEYRKIPIEKMLAYLPKNAEIYYIDKETANRPGVIDLSDRIESWEDTLDFIEQMDCIVSSCTSLVHAAGAMGKTAFVIVPIAEYYIWSTTSKTTRSPWYGDNFQVHKQTKVRSWDEPLSAVRDQLQRLI